MYDRIVWNQHQNSLNIESIKLQPWKGLNVYSDAVTAPYTYLIISETQSTYFMAALITNVLSFLNNQPEVFLDIVCHYTYPNILFNDLHNHL